METSTLSPAKEQIRQLLPQLTDVQANAVLAFAQVLSMDPVSRAIMFAPYDDEPVTPEEEAEVAQAMKEPTVSLTLDELLTL